MGLAGAILASIEIAVEGSYSGEPPSRRILISQIRVMDAGLWTKMHRNKCYTKKCTSD